MTLWVGAPRGKSPPAKFGGHKQHGSGDTLLIVEEEDSTGSRLNLPLLFISG